MMADFLSRAALLEEFKNDLLCCCFGSALKGTPRNEIDIKNVLERIEDFPAEDGAPVVHGNWNIRCDARTDFMTGEVDEEYYLECSECHRKEWDIDTAALWAGNYAKLVADYPYCHCGAKMEQCREENCDG